MKIIRLLNKVKLNKKGMTLVEVIVAMTILTIVVVPTMRIFGSAANTNHSSRLRQRATIVGESVMESFKAYDMEALCKQFRGGVFKGVTTTASTSMTVEAMYGATLGSPFRPDDELDQDATGYIFRANDVISEGQHYDIKIEATPLHEPEVLRMDSPNAYSDAIITFDATFNERLNNELLTAAKEQCMLANSVTLTSITSVELTDFKRTFTINVTDVGGVQTVSVQVNCTGSAKVYYNKPNPTGGSTPQTYNVDLDVNITLPDSTSTDTEWVVYDNTSTIAGEDVNGKICKLNQIYLYYTPAYEYLYCDGAEDEIILNANLSSLYDPSVTTEPEAEGYMPLRFNVAKQVLAGGISDAEYNNNEVNYGVSVTGNITGGGEVVFISNFDQNLSGGAGVLSPVPVAGFSDMKTYAIDSPDLENGFIDEVELMYDLVVHVYEHGDGDDDSKKEVAVFFGTKND